MGFTICTVKMMEETSGGATGGGNPSPRTDIHAIDVAYIEMINKITVYKLY